jgi:hypothetical protein
MKKTAFGQFRKKLEFFRTLKIRNNGYVDNIFIFFQFTLRIENIFPPKGIRQLFQCILHSFQFLIDSKKFFIYLTKS